MPSRALSGQTFGFYVRRVLLKPRRTHVEPHCARFQLFLQIGLCGGRLNDGESVTVRAQRVFGG